MGYGDDVVMVKQCEWRPTGRKGIQDREGEGEREALWFRILRLEFPVE